MTHLKKQTKSNAHTTKLAEIFQKAPTEINSQTVCYLPSSKSVFLLLCSLHVYVVKKVVYGHLGFWKTSINVEIGLRITKIFFSNPYFQIWLHSKMMALS